MLRNKVDFNRISGTIQNWKWNELKIGLEKSIISNSDIRVYAVRILTEEVEDFDTVLELSIAENVEKIILNLALKEGEQDAEIIKLKWIFAIIYDAFIYLYDEVYSIIEDVYVEFEYPREISNLIGYMPCDDGKSMDYRLNEYIENGKHIWC